MARSRRRSIHIPSGGNSEITRMANDIEANISALWDKIGVQPDDAKNQTASGQAQIIMPITRMAYTGNKLLAYRQAMQIRKGQVINIGGEQIAHSFNIQGGGGDDVTNNTTINVTGGSTDRVEGSVDAVLAPGIVIYDSDAESYKSSGTIVKVWDDGETLTGSDVRIYYFEYNAAGTLQTSSYSSCAKITGSHDGVYTYFTDSSNEWVPTTAIASCDFIRIGIRTKSGGGYEYWPVDDGASAPDPSDCPNIPVITIGGNTNWQFITNEGAG